MGIDLGVTRFATLSDGSHETVIQLPGPDPQLVQALRRAQRCQSRRCRFGKNWQKARGRVQKIHARITNKRLDRVHKVTAQISKNHAIVCLEKFQIRNMTRSSRGGVGSVDRNARRRSALNRAILQQNWFEFRPHRWPHPERRGRAVIQERSFEPFRGLRRPVLTHARNDWPGGPLKVLPH